MWEFLIKLTGLLRRTIGMALFLAILEAKLLLFLLSFLSLTIGILLFLEILLNCFFSLIIGMLVFLYFEAK